MIVVLTLRSGSTHVVDVDSFEDSGKVLEGEGVLKLRGRTVVGHHPIILQVRKVEIVSVEIRDMGKATRKES